MIKKLFKSNILKDTMYTLGGKIVAMLFYMAFDIVCARILTPEDYAEWIFFFAVLTMMFYIGWCGVNTSAKVFVSKESTKEGVSEIIRASFFLRLTVNIVMCLIIISIAYPLARCLGYPEKYPNLFFLCVLAGALVFFNSYSEYFKEVFMGLGEFRKLCFITSLEYAGYFLFSLLFLISYGKVEAAAFGHICSGMMVFLFGYMCLTRISVNDPFAKKKNIFRLGMGKIFKYAIPIAISSIGGMILVEMDTFMLGIMSTKMQVAYYGIAKNLCTKATHVNYALTVGSMTSFSILTVENIKEKRLKFMRTSYVNVLISAFIASAFLLLGTFVITILYSIEYQEAGLILKYLVPYYVMYSISNFFATFLDFQGKAKIKSLCYSTVICLNLCLNLLLIPQFGAVGAAIATSLSLVPYMVLVIAITAKVINSYSNGKINIV